MYVYFIARLEQRRLQITAGEKKGQIWYFFVLIDND